MIIISLEEFSDIVSVADPDPFYMDPDPDFHFDPDPDFQFDMDPDRTV
jgi:hypothetical protein